MRRGGILWFLHLLHSLCAVTTSTAMAQHCETTDVIIIGCGPTGALLTALLGRFGVANVLLEKQALITEDPRGIALDEDGIRLLQAVGIYDKVYTEIGSCELKTVWPALLQRVLTITTNAGFGTINFIAGKNDLHTKPFLVLNYNTVGDVSPERTVRQALTRGSQNRPKEAPGM